MAQFQFRFEKVLKQRFRIEDERKNDLARVQSRINREYMRIEDLAAWRQNAKNRDARVLDSAETGLLAFLMQSSCDCRAAAKRRILRMEPELNRVRAAYTRARQERIAMEKLRERELTEYRRRERLAEERMLSELAEQQHMRQEEDADA